MNPVIEVENLSCRYGRREAVHDATFALPRGSIGAFLGPNGAGKTTTIKTLLNLRRPASGAARVLGCDSRKLSARDFARIGYVSENQQLPDVLTVAQFLAYVKPLYSKWDDAMATRLAEQFALPLDRKLKHLSRGMRMKAQLLSVLPFHPELLVMDEPFSGLDPLVREDVSRGLLELTGEGEWSVFLSSHDIDEVERLADWVAIILDGRVRIAEPVATLQARHRRIDIAGDRLAERTPSRLPGGWLEFEPVNEHRLRFVHTLFRAEQTERELKEIWPDASVVATPLSLRDIFVVRARAEAKAN